jgi:hypothetical protein
MEPQEDPEARIRELERPLADDARSSELGGSQGSATYLPPPVDYGGPYAPPPQFGTRVPDGTGSAVRAGVFVILGIVVIVIAGAVAYFVTASNNDADIPTSPKPPAVHTGRPVVPDAPGAPTLSPGEKYGVAGVGANKVITCNDGVVTVSGVSNTVTISGHCAAVTVSGMQNAVVVDAVDTIVVSGIRNRVTYHSGEPEIQKSGQDNTVGPG